MTITRVLSFRAHSIIAAETQLFLVQHGKALAAGEVCAKSNWVGIEVSTNRSSHMMCDVISAPAAGRTGLPPGCLSKSLCEGLDRAAPG
jgi:hypothetical protein